MERYEWTDEDEDQAVLMDYADFDPHDAETKLPEKFALLRIGDDKSGDAIMVSREQAREITSRLTAFFDDDA